MQNEKNITTPTLVPTLSPVEESLQELSRLLTTPNPLLIDFLSALAFDGGTHLFSNEVKALPVFRTNLTSGYNYSFETKMLAYVRFGITTSKYFVIQSLILDGKAAWVSHYYSADGKYSFSEGPISHHFCEASEVLMEANCPILNHLYNVLSAEYSRVNAGNANTISAYLIERTLRRIQKTNGHKLSIALGIHDSAIRVLNDRLMSVELDPVYNWKERRSLFSSIKKERASLIRTKKRAHQKSFLSYTLPLIAYDMKAAFQRFKKRPYNNTVGLLDTILLDPIRWFGGVVRSNLGLSVAMAIYSPFTYFFITQPMNPHAMSVVGSVRSAYLQTTDTVSHLLSNGATVTTTAAVKAHTAGTLPRVNLKKITRLFNRKPVACCYRATCRTWQTKAGTSV
jgi:hypothetical protein